MIVLLAFCINVMTWLFVALNVQFVWNFLVPERFMPLHIALLLLLCVRWVTSKGKWK